MERLLRGKGKLRDGSNLARTLRRAIDAGIDKDVSSEVTAIPGEFRQMYNRAQKVLGIKDISSIIKHSIRQSAFSNARSMDELKAEVKEAFPDAKMQEQGNKLIFTMPNG